jgi:hypothetical protein
MLADIAYYALRLSHDLIWTIEEPSWEWFTIFLKIRFKKKKKY